MLRNDVFIALINRSMSKPMTGESIYVYCCLRPLPPGRGPHYSPPTTLAPPRQNQTGLAQDPQGPADPLWLCDGVPKTGHVHKNQNWNMIKGWSCTPSPCGRREAVERELPCQAGRGRPALLAMFHGLWSCSMVHGICN